ncbi:NmrA-like family domain-containing protein 1 [Colletotrichum spaethianum]|uniref:NmrA-like family domain-containing protein 1 n=1 Tax=Colletotrichum spaethianum TaxID=700344 RepID=A0AA37LG25_9PEZI|nr:NmrA-like family domain-containing protein 1 [Colletotrichum spaethianum]GKT43482.1 NmrA-like family domain-containing protein 1 [Colletotrichum spaethianum]
MSSRIIAIIGGTGAQGMPVVRDLAKSGSYKIRALTRDRNSPRFRDLQTCGPPGTVEPVIGTFASESSLRELFRGVWGAFINIDGFNCGEKTEMYWSIRAYELAIEAGVKFYVYGSLVYGYKVSGFRSEYRAGHIDAKGRIGEWILKQNDEIRQKHGMSSALFSTAPYMEMTIHADMLTPPTVEDGVVTWRVPLGNGSVPFVALEDCGYYVKWLFDNYERAHGMNLDVAIDHITYTELAAAFQRVTGKPARYIDVSFDDYFATNLAADGPVAYNADPNDPATMTRRENFTGFWMLWRDSPDNNGLVKKNYALLDEVHPGRIRSAEQWFRREDQRGREKGFGSLWERVQKESLVTVLKLYDDGGKGLL